MKRLISLFLTILLFSGVSFATDPGCATSDLMGLGMPGALASRLGSDSSCGSYQQNDLIPKTDGDIDLGDATHGFGAAYLSDGTGGGSLTFSTHQMLIQTTTAHNLLFGRNGSTLLGLSGTEIYSTTDAAIGLGTSSKGFKALYLSDATGKGSLTFDAGHLLNISTSGTTIIWGTSDTTRMKLTSSQFYPATNDGVGLGSSTSGFSYVIVASPDGTRSQCSVDNSDNWTCTGL